MCKNFGLSGLSDIVTCTLKLLTVTSDNMTLYFFVYNGTMKDLTDTIILSTYIL